MAYSYVVYTGNGATTQYAIPFQYIRKEHVKVFVNFVDTAYTYANNTTVLLASAPANGARVEVRRITPASTPLVDFVDGSTLVASDLDTSNLQHLFLEQELDDNTKQAVSIDPNTGLPTASNQRITNLAAPVAATDAANKNYVDTFVSQTANIADSAITSAKILDGTIVAGDLAADSVTTVKVLNANITEAKLATDSVSTAKIVNSAVTTTKVADANITEAKLATDAVTVAKIRDGEITSAKLNPATVVTNAEVAGVSPNDTSFYTTSASDLRYFRQDSSETINSGMAWSSGDGFVATTAAIDARIIDLVDDVGGFVPIANETSFPATNPDINNPDNAGTIISVAQIITARTPVNGTVTIANGSGGNTVTINGCGATVLAANYGLLVETTATLHTYTFHRLVPRATEVTTVAGIAGAITTAATNVADINNFADLYQIGANAPALRADGTARQEGDLWFDTQNDVVQAFNGTNYAPISPTQATLNDIAIVSNDLSSFNDFGFVTDALIPNQTGGSLQTCATNIANINAVSSQVTPTNNVGTVAGIAGNVTTVAGVAANVTTVAGSIGDVNRYANEYTVSASQPATTVAGRLWFDTVASTLKFYTGAVWASISAGIASVQSDLSPVLGGHLNANNKNINNVATIDGADLTIDFGTI